MKSTNKHYFSLSGRIDALVPSDDAVAVIAISETAEERPYFWGSAEAAGAHFEEQGRFLARQPRLEIHLREIRAGYRKTIFLPATHDATVEATLTCNGLIATQGG